MVAREIEFKKTRNSVFQNQKYSLKVKKKNTIIFPKFAQISNKTVKNINSYKNGI